MPDSEKTALPNGPLHGIRVLDLTSVIMGPFATQILADFGAEVITVEKFGGSDNRRMGDGPHQELSGIALNLLRNKQSISLDLKNRHGRAAALKIAMTCDVVVTNLRPKPLKRLGLAYEDFVAVNERIVYCQAHGFRSDSDRADDPAYDDIIQAESGISDLSIRLGRGPALVPTILADKICGLTIVNAVMAALLHRAATGQGQRVEVPMADVMRAFVLVEHGAGAMSVPATGNIGWSRVLSPERGPQRTLDGWISILPYSAAAYAALFAVADRADVIDLAWTKQDLARQSSRLYKLLKEVVANRTTSFWLDFCKERNIPVGRIATLEELVASLPTERHPDAGEYHVIPAPIWFAKTPAGLRVPAPRVGQDGRQILRRANISDRDIDQMVDSGALQLRD